MTPSASEPPQAQTPEGRDPEPAEPTAAARAPRPATQAAGEGPLQALRRWIDRLLVADVFVVLAGALWFVVAVLLHSQGVDTPLRSFQALWEPLFTPAIGLLMAGALLSGALGWWQRRGQR